jgi:hypothetical protein
MEIIETSSSTPRTSSRKTIRRLLTAAVAVSALSVPVASAVSVTASEASGHSVSSGGGGGHGITPDSHRLALGTVQPDSLRLT